MEIDFLNLAIVGTIYGLVIAGIYFTIQGILEVLGITNWNLSFWLPVLVCTVVMTSMMNAASRAARGV